MMDLPYRSRQFFHSLTAYPTTQDMTVVTACLPPSLAQLFRQMRPADQAHGLRVLRALLAEGERHPDLLAAALLHDVGKSRLETSPLERALTVVATWLLPQRVKHWGNGEPTGLRRPFVVAARHPLWGAEMIREAGGSEQLAMLVRRHHEPLRAGSTSESEALLARLQAADKAS